MTEGSTHQTVQWRKVFMEGLPHHLMNYGAQAGLEYEALPGHPSPRSNAFVTVNTNVALYELKVTLALQADINRYYCVQ